MTPISVCWRSAPIFLVCGVCLGLASAAAVRAADPDIPPADLAAAGKIFAEVRALSNRDGGALWGVTLYGPVMFVDADTRRIFANQADAGGQLRPAGEVFVGILPPTDIFANTAAAWSGTFWTQVQWPLPKDPVQRDKLIAHELFHRIHDQLPLPPLMMTDNAHLDTLQGRYLLQLEWRALSQALAAATDAARRAAAHDALLFRARRYHLFSNAPDQESSLELNEGLAEYTGVKAGIDGHGAQVQAAQRDLRVHAEDSSFVRSFAYATGPAYGLLLDEYLPDWRQQLAHGKHLDGLLAQALHFKAPADTGAGVNARAQLYGGATLLQSETVRDSEREKRLAAYRATFVEHPVLVLPIPNPRFTFDPNEVQSFQPHGTVFPNLSATQDWGILKVVEKGALVSPKWDRITLSAPTSSRSGHLAGDGWTLELSPGWLLVPGTRPGDFTVVPPSGAQASQNQTR
jgi:hypothetical protein